MLLGGLWHGAAMTFIVWGAIHGGFLCLERVVRERWRVLYPEPVLPAAASLFLRWPLTFHVVCLAWPFFRAACVGTALDLLGGLVSGPRPPPLVTPLHVVTIPLSIPSHFVHPTPVPSLSHRHAIRPPGLHKPRP